MLSTARAYPNPTFSFQYTKDIPRHHSIARHPARLPVGAQFTHRRGDGRPASGLVRAWGSRAPRSRSTADTAYARVLALEEHARLGRRDALDADSLLHMARRRLEAGDASELDVHLAEVNAGQLENTARIDSLTAVLALLDLQRLIGHHGRHAGHRAH